MIKFEFTSEKEMLGLGARLARLLRGEGVVHLSGGPWFGENDFMQGHIASHGSFRSS